MAYCEMSLLNLFGNLLVLLGLQWLYFVVSKVGVGERLLWKL